MLHTVLHKSAWNNDQWIVYGTFDSKQSANDAIDVQPKHEKTNMHGDFYYTKIMRHFKDVSLMTNWDNAVVTFNDGTKALAN